MTSDSPAQAGVPNTSEVLKFSPEWLELQTGRDLINCRYPCVATSIYESSVEVIRPYSPIVHAVSEVDVQYLIEIPCGINERYLGNAAGSQMTAEMVRSHYYKHGLHDFDSSAQQDKISAFMDSLDEEQNV
ncbi:hypothetical protein BGZ46_000984 [Entomortierella lignicola]|nr:hypothetical protein BGZ46_000984 [Entomortierella lignicola]